MILISRSMVRQFRAVARLAGLAKHRPTSPACVRIVATHDSMSLQVTNGRVAVEHRSAGQFTSADITVPFQLFADCEAKSDGAVTIRVEEDSRLVATWHDRGVPQQKDYGVPANTPELPPFARELVTNPRDLLVALREAKATADQSATRYSLDCIQLKGATGTIVATDTRQLLLQSGFRFPWQDDVLMRASGVFASRELPSELPVEIGRTEEGVTIRIGEWTIHHEVDKAGRFPKLDQVIPSPTAIRTRMQVDSADAKFLAATVSRLPADDLTDRPLTLELNGSVVVRARKDGQSPVTELLLSRSRRMGDQMRIHTNREYFSRALELGFSEIGFVDNKSPCMCQDSTRTYIWMVLEPEAALEPTAAAQTIDSLSMTSGDATTGRGTNAAATKAAKSEGSPITSPETTLTVSTPVNRVAEHFSQRTAVSVIKDEVTSSSTASQPIDVIEQALNLRNQLRTIVQGLTELVTQIRQQKKQTRLMKSTLQSLKQLQLLDA